MQLNAAICILTIWAFQIGFSGGVPTFSLLENGNNSIEEILKLIRKQTSVTQGT